MKNIIKVFIRILLTLCIGIAVDAYSNFIGDKVIVIATPVGKVKPARVEGVPIVYYDDFCYPIPS